MATANNYFVYGKKEMPQDASLHGRNDENKESITLIWFDPNIGSHEDNETTKQKLRAINDYVTFCTEVDECIQFIQSVAKEKIFIITSGSKAVLLLRDIHHLRQVDAIFIFCMKPEKFTHLPQEYPKIIGIYNRLDELCSSIQEQLDLLNEQIPTFCIFDHHQKSTKDLSKQSAEFLWFQLFHHVIIQFPRQEHAKQEMLDVCRHYYHGNLTDLELIDQFEREYHPEDAIWWYSQQSFVYKLVNKALRTEDIDQLRTFRFFIGDLSQQLIEEQQKMLSSRETVLVVYRGAKLDREEFEKLKENQDQLISTNGYLSTSRLREPALAFAMKPSKRTDVVSVLFQIQCDTERIGGSVTYADIASLSKYPKEEEVLFDLNASFRLESIEEDRSIQVIKMAVSNEGEKLTKNYIEVTQREAEETSMAIMFGKLMCDLGEYAKSQKYFEDLLREPNGEDIAWIEFNIGRALDYQGLLEQARNYYDRAYDRMMNAEPPRLKDSAQVLNNIGGILNQQGKQDEALEHYFNSLRVHKKFYPSGHPSIATNLNNIGGVLTKQEKYDEALDYHQQVLTMNKKFYPSGHADIAHSLNNIGKIFYHQGKHDEAMDYYQRALTIRKQLYPSGHMDICNSLYNIGCVFQQQQKYKEALEQYQRALKMNEKLCSSGNRYSTKLLENIAVVLDTQGEYERALRFYQRALKMREKLHPLSHADIAGLFNKIGLCHEHLRQFEMAKELYHQALSVYEKCLLTEHPDRVETKRNIRRVAREC